MQIDLNGMYYILNIRLDDPARGMVAEIIDDGFRGPVRRSDVRDIGDIVRLIRGYTGLKPDADTLQDISRHLEDRLDRAMAFVAEPMVLQKAG